MAFKADSTITTNRQTQAFNRIAQRQGPLDIISQQSPFVAATLGKRSIDSKLNYATPNFERLEKLSGDKLESIMMASLKTISTITNGSSELGAITLTAQAPFVGQTWSFTHYNDTHPVVKSEVLMTSDADVAKVGKALTNHANYILASYADTIGQAVHQTSANNAQTEDYLGSWLYAVDDTNVYGTINRSDAANGVFRGNVQAVGGALSLLDLDTVITNCRKRGRPDFGVFGPTEWNYFNALMRSNGLAIIQNGDNNADFGFETITYNGIKFAMDPYSPSGYGGIFTTNTWKWGAKVFKGEIGGQGAELMLSASDFKDTDIAKSAYIMKTDLFAAFVCLQPNANGKLTGITG